MEAEREEQITLEYPNADVLAILEVWEKLTGKKALHDSTVQGPCGIDVRKPVSKTEAIRIIESALLLNGFTLVPGPGDTIVRVLGASKSPRQFGPPLYTDLSELPENDVVVSFLFRLEHADPTEVHAVLSQYIVPTPYSTLMPLPKAQSLLVIENTNVIRSLAAIVAQMDRKPAEVVSEFITLQRADAKEVIEKLNTIFEKQPTPGAPGTQAAAAAAAPAPPAPANGANGEGAAPSGEALGTTLSEDSLIVGKIKLTADTRTNRIHVVTRPVNMPLVQRLIEEFDSDIPFGEPTTRPLRFVSAGEVLDVVMKAITDPGAKEDAGTGSSASTAKAAAPISNPTNYPGTSSAYGRTGGGSLGGEELSTREVDTVPEARTVGSTKIIADKRSNSIIVLGNREVKDKIFKILDEIDVRAPQVMLTAVIGELNLTDTKEFGVNYLLRAKGIGVTGSGGTVTGANDRTFAGIASNVGGVTNDVKNLTSASALASTLGTGGLGLNGFIGASKTLEAVVHALESTGRFRVTSRPMVFTSNNKKALIASGQEVAVPGQIQSGYGNSGIGTVNNNGLVSTSNVEYKDVFLKLEVQPLINSDNEVTLDIVQEVNSLANGAGLTTSSGIQAPTINTRRIKTTVSVANNATVVLGGLVTENRTDERSGIPVLGKLPLLGPLFSSKSKAVTRNELVVLIRPTVANTPVDAIKESERSQEKLNFPPDLDATLDPPGTREKIGGKPEMLHPPKAVLRSEN
jgi:type II secretion system protein D